MAAIFSNLIVSVTSFWVLVVLLSTSLLPSINNAGGNHHPVVGVDSIIETEAVRIRHEQKFINFLRIPKTGSTSMVHYLDEYSGLMDLDRILMDKAKSLRRYEGLACLYGPEPTDGMERPEYPSSVCSHTEYSINIETWKKAAGKWVAQQAPYDRRKHGNHHSINISLRSFTIVREPFDRLWSYFHYVHRRNALGIEPGMWRGDHTQAQYDCVLKGDFEGWLHLAHRDGMPHSPQHEYLADTIDEAIEMIEGDKVTVLVNECFEASLRLLAGEMSLGMDTVEDFLDSDDFLTNTAPKHNSNAEEEKRSELRKRTKEYFPEEYLLYNTAVAQFKRHLPSLQAMGGLRQTCELNDSYVVVANSES